MTTKGCNHKPEELEPVYKKWLLSREHVISLGLLTSSKSRHPMSDHQMP
jgi:hypothetical protein